MEEQENTVDFNNFFNIKPRPQVDKEKNSEYKSDSQINKINFSKDAASMVETKKNSAENLNFSIDTHKSIKFSYDKNRGSISKSTVDVRNFNFNVTV